MEESKSQIRLLVVSYFYPPIGGAGLPGSQRAVKFVRYLPFRKMSVLTVAPEALQHADGANFIVPLPINGETIVRAESYDVFGFLLKCRQVFRSIIFRPAAKAITEVPNSATSNQRNNQLGAKSWAVRVKDYVYELCHFPDGASGWLIPGIVAGRKLLKSDRPDIVFASGMPWTALLVAYVLHKVTGIPYIADFRDPWVGNPFHPSRGVLLDKLSLFLERKVVKSAALVSANTDPLREDFLRRYPQLDPERFVVLPNGFDPGDFSATQADLPVSDGIPGPLVITHAGYFYGERDPSVLFRAFELLAKEDRVWLERLKFVHMGQISLEYDIQSRFHDSIAQGVFVDLGQVPYRECLQRLRASDVLLILQGGTKTQVPSKLYDYLCIGRPMLTLTPVDGALGQMVKEYSFGLMFDPDDAEGVAAKLKELWWEKQVCGQLVVEYPNKDIFDVRKITERLADYIEKIVKKTMV